MKRILFVVDPLGGSASVQFELLRTYANSLGSLYHISVFSPYCSRNRWAELEAAGCELIVPRTPRFRGNRVLSRFAKSNESMLWAESWVREALLHLNSHDAEGALRGKRFDYVINMSMTVPVPCNLWWILGTPLDVTIEGMASTNLIARLADAFGQGAIRQMDGRIIKGIQGVSREIVANSPFLRDFYVERNVPVRGVVYTLKDLRDFHPNGSAPARNYVLMYVGKETDLVDTRALRDAGVKVIGFGGKIPTSSQFRKLTECIDFRGHVSEGELVELYTNALFTMFPFSCEPMGLVPLESMACGTPVLTYARQGPASTVLDGKTGWLVRSAEEMIAKASELWRRKDTGLTPTDCVSRAQEFSYNRTVADLKGWIEGANGH